MKILRALSQGPILLVLAYILAYVLMVFTYHLKRLWLLLCPLFVIGKH